MKLFLYSGLLLFFINGYSQATITEETMVLDTYGFDTPNPAPILTENPKIYPYFKYEGYSHTSTKKNWNVVKLENEYIEVYILPEIGGKVWGAVEKSTGNEFLYKNEVVKFRNIAMRGPWTSGGIEFNFGIIGHHPATATPVDYMTRTNSDGSVSCVVGNLDLPSRTYWQVEIKLEKDKAYFETNASWYNGTPLDQSYYNWMTGAAVATNDLEFFIPGNGYLEHNGTWEKWPIDDQGRNLALYKNNDFGPAKSYHIVGDYQNYFGGYYHDRNVGFGHLAPYEQMPGQKLWLWALSRSGGIWEDLLTDSDGQYIEFQAGRLFNQYSPGAENPITQANFDPYVMDSWSEQWFPIKQIGGMEAASKYGVLNVERNGNSAYLGINALQAFDEPLQILVNGKEVSVENLRLQPMQVFEKTIACKDTDILEVNLGKGKLYYTSKSKTLLKRSFEQDADLKISEVEKLYHEASEAIKFREYAAAEEQLKALLALDPSHPGGLALSSISEYRKTNYSKALDYANKGLQLDIYNPTANYLSGIAYWAQNDALNALEAFGWSARSIQYRSVSYAQMAEIHLHEGNLQTAEDYAKKALDYNQHNLNARQVLLVVHRKMANTNAFNQQIQEISKISPINHFAAFEQILLSQKDPSNVLEGIQNEFPNETLLELALSYINLGQQEAATQVLGITKDLKSKLLMAYLDRNSTTGKSAELLDGLSKQSPNFVFPYRRETLPVLEWAASANPNWKFKYYLAQNYLSVGLDDKAKNALEECGEAPDNDTFYRFRAKVFQNEPYAVQLKDYEKALELNNGYWKNWDDLMLFFLKHDKNEAAANLGKKVVQKFPKNYNVGLSYAKALVATNAYPKAISILNNIQILPFEHASESKRVYTQAHLYQARKYMAKNQFSRAIPLLEASKKWPENLGVGAPYNPDDRMANYLLGLCHSNMGNTSKANAAFKEVADYETASVPRLNDIFSALAMKKLNQQDSLQKLLEKIKSGAAKNQNAAIVWALYNQNTDQAKNLMVSEGTDERLIDILTDL
ncbi:DUF5107 domain-containing protein [Flagellimonas olearia]|uniref:DUF5107 domain-containing protein n=1 Tax=Flagellimonas olearia TaxID=552546 RepID=A0A444VQK5_9FLAO|nr:DUF5107 domain-containing protein [Allomuricauda olearia]RYC53115.1 hypothetical protein DN53_02535 [Allomuricauda olearia]